MRLFNRFCVAVVCGVLASGAVLHAAEASEPTGPVVSLFNGQNLDGWTVTNCEARVENGSLVLKSGNGLVRAHHQYGDFTLELEWKARKAQMYDSGIYFRAELPSGPRPWPTRYQANLLEGLEGNVNNLKGAASTGLIKPGEWNHFKLTVVGSKAALAINGKPAWEADGIEPARGYIGLQAEVDKGGEFEFRNIRIVEHGYRSLFDGKDFSRDWEGADADASVCWKVEEGLLVCTGQKGPWLRSREQVGDFNLRLEYKLKPGGNSGVFVRVPKGGAHQGREKGGGPSGTEIQILDDASERYKDIKPYQFSGSVYAIAPAREHVSLPAGHWNTLEINCVGTSYRITHNGVVIVDAAESEFPELKNREVRGYLGLQNHSEEVWFRNLRIGPPVRAVR
jgi:hypothetical protein